MLPDRARRHYAAVHRRAAVPPRRRRHDITRRRSRTRAARLIVDLSRLRWLFVTARGSSFRRQLRRRRARGRSFARRALCVSGSIARARLESARVGWPSTQRDGGLWAEHYEAPAMTCVVRTEIRSQSSPRHRIPLHEAAPPASARPKTRTVVAFHLGLQRVSLNRADTARGRCSSAVGQHPRFARAPSSRCAFQRRSAPDRRVVATTSPAAAPAGLELDPLTHSSTSHGPYALAHRRPGNGPQLLQRRGRAPISHKASACRRGPKPGRTGAHRCEHVDLAMRLILDPLHYAMLGRALGTHDAGRGCPRGSGPIGPRGARRARPDRDDRNRGTRWRATTGTTTWAANARAEPGVVHEDFQAFPMQRSTRARVKRSLIRFGF
jgi:hypothetical protein